jgi:two-component SAPR family response regulator
MKGNKLIKEWKVTYFNNYYELPIEEYNIDYSYYTSKAREIINNIENIQQLKLL